MIRALKSLRDFLDTEQLKWLPGNLKVVPCILLTQNVGGDTGPMRTILQVFDAEGVHIGTIENPAFIPNKKV
jgi:hypothetical protein